jgi:hypothetical protein
MQYRVRIEDRYGHARALEEGGSVQTSEAQDGYEIVQEKKMFSRREFSRVAALVLQRRAGGQSGSQLTFGPVIERVVYETTTGRDCFLDLETGLLLQPPLQVMALFAATNWQKHYMDEPEATDPMRAWVWASGADLVYGAPAFTHEGGLILLDGEMIGTEDYWKMGAGQVAKLLQETEATNQAKIPGAPSLVGDPPFVRNDQLPRSEAFRTMDGTIGVLQVISFTDNPRGVRIRYKLVQDSQARVALKPIPPKAAELAAAWMVYAKAYGESRALTDTNVQVAFSKVARARLKEIEDLLKGTVAEPLVRQQQEAIAEMRRASQTKDMERVRMAQDQLRAISTQLEKMLGLADVESGVEAAGSAAAHPPFVVQLAQGEIELLALCQHPSTNQPWWRPDGTPWSNAGFENNTRHESETKGQRLEFVFQRRGLPKDTSLEYSFEPSALEVSSGDQPQRQRKALPDHSMVVPLLPELAKEVNIRLGVAAGEWRKVVTRTPQSGAGGAFMLGKQTCRALFLDPVESGGETRIAVSYNKVPGWTVRVTALDISGKLHVSPPHMQSTDDVASSEGRFSRLPLSAVKEFRFEARPYTYVEFRHISLEPGVRTRVEVVGTEDH